MINVIVVTYNGIQWIDRCLGSLQNQPLISDIIVIDNGSTDGTIERIKENFSETNLILNTQNRGFGYSNNQGLKISMEEKCQYVFLLNQDAWIEDNTLTNLVRSHQQESRYGILSPMHLRGDGKALDMKFATFVAQSENHTLISDLYLHRNEINITYDVQFVNAAAWLISRECFERVGGFAPIYHHYGEDMDYANRVLFHGFKIGICPAAMIHHDRKNTIILPDINKPQEYLKMKRIWHLIYLTDIRHSFTSRSLKTLLISLGNCLKSLLQLNGRHLKTYLQELGILLLIYPKVLSNNRIAKQAGPAFLRSKYP